MPKYRANQVREVKVNHDPAVRSAQGAPLITEGDSGHLAPEAGETACFCPKCGSPYLASFEPGEPRHTAPGEIRLPNIDHVTQKQKVDAEGTPLWHVKPIPQALPGFTCTAGDCGHIGVATRVP